MDGVQLRDEAAQDRVRAAVEFLDPSECHEEVDLEVLSNAIFYPR